MFENRSNGAALVAALPFAHGTRANYSPTWSHFQSSLTLLLGQGLNLLYPLDRELDLYRDAGQCPPSEMERRSITPTEPSAVPAPFPPVQRLPPEILGEIFALCIPMEAYNSADRDAAPLVLLRVCRRWRSVALNTPQLWTRLGLHHLQNVDPLAFVSTWLRRSGAMPLDVYFNPLTWYYPSDTQFKHRTIPDAVKLLAAEIHRIRTFHITNLPAVVQSLLPEGGQIYAPILRDFRVTSIPKSSEHTVAGSICAPSLESLDVCDPHITLQSISYNLHNLLSLHWNGSNASQSWYASWSNLVPILQACPNLEECEIIRPASSEPFSRTPDSRVTLPRLRKLSLLWNKDVDMVDFLQLIDVPLLESLHLELDRPGSSADRDTVQRVFAALFPAAGQTAPPSPLVKELQTVHLDIALDESVPPDLRWPAKLPMLERLSVDGCSIDSAFLKTLTPEFSNAPPSAWHPLLPRLAELRVSRASMDGRHLVRMVAARAAPYHLGALSLRDCGGVSEIDIGVLRAISSSGSLALTL